MTDWTPWISHDKSGCPVPDYFVVEVYVNCPVYGEVNLILTIGVDVLIDDWNKTDRLFRSTPYGILRYRIKKPRALERLKQIARDVPDDTPALTPA